MIPLDVILWSVKFVQYGYNFLGFWDGNFLQHWTKNGRSDENCTQTCSTKLDQSQCRHAKPLAMASPEYVYYRNQAKIAWKANPSPHSVQAAPDCRFRPCQSNNHIYRSVQWCATVLWRVNRGFKHMHTVSPALLALYEVQLCLNLNKCQKVIFCICFAFPDVLQCAPKT